MKKALLILSSLFIFSGVKAQTTLTVKKETVKPVIIKPLTDTVNAKPNDTTIKQTNKAIKIGIIKKTPAVQMKELPLVTKPHKG